MLAGFLFRGLYLDPREVPSPLIDKPAPEFALTQLDKPEQTIRRADMLGKVWMLNVWASWCEACRDEHPYLVEFAKLKALPIYGLDYKDQREPAQQWLAERGNPYDASLFDAQRPRGHRLRRLRRARDLPHRQAGRDPLQADRRADARGAAATRCCRC